MTCQFCTRPVDSGVVCTGCMRRVTRALEITPSLTYELTVTLSRQAYTGSQTKLCTSSGTGHPMPMDARAMEAGDALHTTLARWTRYVAHHRSVAGPFSRGAPAPRHGRPGAGYPERALVDGMAGWLLHHTEWMRQNDRATEYVTEVENVISGARRAVDLPPERWYAGPCDGCGADLYAHPRALSVDCGTPGCGLAYDVEARRKWLLENVTDRLASPIEISRALGTLAGTDVTPSVIRGLAHRGRIEAKAKDAQDRPLYRVGDVLERVLERGAR